MFNFMHYVSCLSTGQVALRCMYVCVLSRHSEHLVLFFIRHIYEWIFFDPVETESSQMADKTYDTHLL